MFSSIRPCVSLIPSPRRRRASAAPPITREILLASLHRPGGRAASSRDGIGTTKTLNELEQEQRHCISTASSISDSDSKLAFNLPHSRKPRTSKSSQRRPLSVPRRQRTRRTPCAQSRLQGYVKVRLLKSSRPWRIPPRGSGRRGGADWVRRLNQIGKPSRSMGPHNPIKRTHYVSFGLWPKDSVWRGQQSTTESLEKINWDWTSNFQTLKIPTEMQRWTTLRTVQVIRYYWGLRSDRDHTSEEWRALQDHDAERLWRNVMLWCLKYRRKQALILLLATFKGRRYRPPRYVISDCLEFLARHFLFKVSNPDRLAVDAIWLMTCKFIDGARDQKQSFPVSQHLIYLIVKHSGDLRLLSIYGLLGLNKAVLHVNTMLRFLDRFIDMGRINLSLQVLDTIVNTNFDLSLDRIQLACVKLLRARFDSQNEYTARLNILKQILGMRIRPGLPMFNTILLNAGEGGDFADAWHMYGLAIKNDLIPDSITYSILLKGARLSGDPSNLKMIMAEIKTNESVLQSLRLVSDVLHAISLTSPGDEFGAMLDFYKQHCDLRPLHELSMIHGSETQVLHGANPHGEWPSSYILTQMILAYVRQHQRSQGLIHNYNLYYQHVKENHPLIAPLAQTDYVANSFIMAFGNSPGTLQHCTTVVKHMLQFSSQTPVAFDSVPYAAPTVQTWSILVASYFRNRQRRSAEKVLDMMRERGIRGDRVTWNTLISGYAGLQDVSAVVDTVKRMDAAGFEVDSYTHKALGRIWLRDRLKEALERSAEESYAGKRIIEGTVPPLNSEEQYEADIALEWGSTILNREEEVQDYLKSKYQERMGMEVEKSSDSQVATA